MRAPKPQISTRQPRTPTYQEMLSQKADIDNQGNKITKEYVNKNLEVEKRIAEELIGQVDETIDYADRAMKSFEELIPQIKAQFKELIEKALKNTAQDLEWTAFHLGNLI